MNKKYELLVDDTITFFGWKLFRIKALISFGSVEAGELGGYVAKEGNLSHEGDAWVSGDAWV
ncbi:polymer-forming cytoskeletal protein, partial [Streptococcus anginosus]|nr:polymer-forming cytoskeletal protein [Streptococcus anginosus]